MSALSKIKSAGFDVGLVDGFIEITPASKLTQSQFAFLKSHKAEIIAELQAETLATHPATETNVSCGQCLGFKSNNAHGRGGGSCLIGGEYGQWSDTRHQCIKFDAMVERVELPEPKPNAIIVKCYTPNGNLIEVEARDPQHAEWLLRYNPPQEL